jgi:hypothetical protein
MDTIMEKNTIRRLESLEQATAASANTPTDIFLIAPSGETSDDVIGLLRDDLFIARAPGESMTELEGRAASSGTRGGVNIWGQFARRAAKE